MKKRLGNPAPVLILALLLGLSTATGLARPAGHPPGPPDPEMMLDRLTDQLDLSDAQRQDLAGIFASHKEAMRAQMEKMRAAREDLSQQIHAETFNESAIRQAAAAVGTLEADGAVERGKLFQEIRKVLTPEQMQKFEQLRQEHRDRMEQWRDNPPGPGSRHGRH